MAKRKQQQALFDLLHNDRGSEKPANAGVPTPVVRTVAPAAAPKPAPAKEPSREAHLGPMTRIVSPRSVEKDERRTIPYGMLAIGTLGVICLGVIGYMIVQRFSQPSLPLPATEKNPTMEQVRAAQPTPDLVVTPSVRPTPVAKGKAAPTPTEAPVVAGKGPAEETPEPALGGIQYRIRIVQLGKPDVADRLRTYLAQHGVETELEASRGTYILFSKARVSDNRKAKELAAQVNKNLESFEKETGIPTSHDAYVVLVKKEP